MFAHAPHAPPAGWVFVRQASRGHDYCSGDGNEPPVPGETPPSPPWLERQPGIAGLPQLLTSIGQPFPRSSEMA